MQVSIILPFKNAAPWVEETIASIQAQSFLDWELICIDDFSTDDSTAIIAGLSDKRIRVLQNTANGIIPALQLGLFEAKGTFITRMDADDIMPHDRLKQMVEALKASPSKTVVTGKVSYFSDEVVSEGYQQYERWLNARVDQNDHFSHLYRECVVASPNWMARKNELIEHHIFELDYPEDYDMVFRWYQQDFTILPLHEMTLLWREHPARTSRNSDVYDQASFFQLKLRWFVHLTNLKNKTIDVFGAGIKGKLVTTFLRQEKCDFRWFDVHHTQYGATVHPARIESPEEANGDIALFCVYPENLSVLDDFMQEKGYRIGENAWFF